jgi:hypothetical protein
MRVKADAKLSTALQGVVRIASNAGDAEIAVRANVTGAISGRMRSIEILGINHKQGDPIEIVFNVQNSGNIPLTYRSNVVVQGPDGNIVFQTKDIDDEVILSLAAGANENFTYFWDAPLDAPIGRYLITASLRYVHDEDILFHDYFDNRFIESRDQPLVFTYLDLREGPLLRVEPLEHDFGILQPGDTPTTELVVSNARQATLTWTVTDVPDWITVLSPAPGVSNASGGTVRFRVNDAIAPGNYDDDLVIESSGGTERIRLTAQIPEPTATPAPTSTPEPTATPALPTVTPEPTQQPATATATTMPTATSVPATSTPAPTATPVPATPTATPAPPTATATTMPTATAAAAAEVEEDEGAEEESGGGCGAPTDHVPAGAAAANLLFLLGPAGLAAFVKMRRR